jgi:hypothetical protein
MLSDCDPFYQPPGAPSGTADPLYSAVPMASWSEHAHVSPGLAAMQAARGPSPQGLLELFRAERDFQPRDC